MDIGEVSKKSGVPVSTLRYYEEKGLIKSTGRNGLRRIFNPSVVEQLGLINLGVLSGFSLEEIGKNFSRDGKVRIDKSKLLKKAADLDQKIKELEAMKNGLAHAANCPAPNHLECPTFRRLINVASKKRKKKI
ncbi:MAG: helix-turn-helix domain-containing protein [Bdellovibrionales bacterium]|nr:helix-turn-helix domain-containing protein [Bdellovibrionales bacterium]